MSNTIGSVLADLLCVFHLTCEKEGVPYILWGETARAAALFGDIPEGFVKVEVAVPACYCSDLTKALNSIDCEKYACESWVNNPKLPFLTARLHNKQTTYFNFKQMDSFSGFGIRLEILPLRAPGLSRAARIEQEKKRCSLLLPHTHFSSCDSKKVIECVDECLSDAAQFFESVTQAGFQPSKYEIWHPEKRARSLSARYLTDTMDVQLSNCEEIKFRVPREFDSYMDKVSKHFWRDRKFGNPANSQKVWISTGLPYVIAKKAFDQAGFPIEDFNLNRIKYDQAKRDVDHLYSRLSGYRAVVRAVHNEISMETYYNDQRQGQIVGWFVAGDWDNLRSVFAPYRQWMIENVTGKIDYPISLPVAIQVIFIMLLEHDGDEYVALRAWHCLTRRCERNDIAKMCSTLRCGEWS